MTKTSLRIALLTAHRDQLREAGHSGGQVVELGPQEFGPSCGCGYLGRPVATEPAAIDSLLGHLLRALTELQRNHAGNGSPTAGKNARQNAGNIA
jgi:hypothetical protein